MKKSRIPSAIIFTIVAILFITIIGVIAYSSEIKIKAYDADVYIDSYGNMEVTENWIIEYPSTYNVRFRDIPYEKGHYDNPLFNGKDFYSDKASFDKNYVNVEVIDLDEGIVLTEGKDYRVGYSFNGDRDEEGYRVECAEDCPYECESIFVDMTNYGGMKGTKQFIYTYTILGAVTEFNDVSELNWRLFEYAESKIKDVQIRIHLPSNSYSIDNLLVWGHGTTNGYLDVVDNQNIKISARNVKANDFLEFRVVFPSEIISELDSSHHVSGITKNDILKYENKLTKISNIKYYAATIFNVLTIVLAVVMVFVFISTYKKYDKEYEYSLDSEYLREPPSEITPAELGYLIKFGKIENEVVTATILDLVTRKILVLSDKGYEISSDSPDFDISIKEGADIGSLEQHEKDVVNFLINTIGDGNSVNTKDIKKYGSKTSEANKTVKFSDNIKKNIKNEYSGKKYFEDARSLAFGKRGRIGILYIVLGAIVFFISNLFGLNAIINGIVIVGCGIIFLVYVLNIKKRTVDGNKEYVKWMAFKKFLNEFSNFEDYPMPSIVIWEKYLVYATVLGVADKVMKQLEVKLESLGNDDGGTFFYYNYGMHHYNFYFYHTLNRTYSNVYQRSVSTIAAQSAGSASGGHGGGFSGGSSFGGGGGGGRSR